MGKQATSVALRFETDLEQQHQVPGSSGGPSALLINPEAGSLVLINAAQARMQAVCNAMSAWLMTNDTDADVHEILRPLDHLAQEVASLLDAAAHRVGVVADDVGGPKHE